MFGLLFLLNSLELLGLWPYRLKEVDSVVTDDLIEAAGATFIECLQVSTVLQQQIERIEVAQIGRMQRRRPALASMHVDGGMLPLLERQVHHSNVVMNGCIMKYTIAMSISFHHGSS